MKRMFMLFVFLFALFTVHAQDEQQALEDILSEFAAGAAVTIQVTTPDGQWSAAAGGGTTVEDRFRIGSMSKTYLAVLALMLQDEEIISLDDPASQWLPGEIVENIANVDSVSIRQLLQMRSGIEDYLGTDEFWAAVENDPNHNWTAEEVLTFAYDLPEVSAPDEEFYYSNTNYLLVQVILEAATGKPLHTLFREYILDPLELEDTYSQVTEGLPGGFVASYFDFDGDGEDENVSEINDGAGLADGGLISNVADVSKFYEALLQEQTLLSEDAMEELLDFQDAGDGDGYSLGLNSFETDWGKIWGHSGGVLGFSSNGLYFTEEDVIIITLAADEEFPHDDLADAIIEALLNS